ncbi:MULTISPECIES: phosphate/phosphite/phosphonate ABC transporter substrate-binding protein [Myxococcaceae]|uniref:phosphate/phosphite/phosphonate ABC transporter substrate-binding protein n=1 Tax=Myxococcaceae TaxID=31 RepID=UPI001E4C4BDC|nr:MULTISPECIES: phosphate/phosphite/phosphonate ABC transporter substrate-binding protein [Myxococcaceae]
MVLPSGLGAAVLAEHAPRVESVLSRALGQPLTVAVAPTYEALAADMQAGRAQVAWAPPFVCARLEAAGARVLLRGLRRGTASYRAALVCKVGAPVTLGTLQGTTVAWTDRDSAGGYLLPVAFLKGQGLEPGKLFAQQLFAGSYAAAVDAVLEGRAQVASIFAPPASVQGADFRTWLRDVAPGREEQLALVAYTDESPNDGVVVHASLPAQTVEALERALRELGGTPTGERLLKELFRADGFEPAPRNAYRALYRLALASL